MHEARMSNQYAAGTLIHTADKTHVTAACIPAVFVLSKMAVMCDLCAWIRVWSWHVVLRSVLASAGIPVWISWLKYLSFVFYGYGQLVHVEFKDRQLYSCTDPNAAAGMHTTVVLHTLCAYAVHCKQVCMAGVCVILVSVAHSCSLGLQSWVPACLWFSWVPDACIAAPSLLCARLQVHKLQLMSAIHRLTPDVRPSVTHNQRWVCSKM